MDHSFSGSWSISLSEIAPKKIQMEAKTHKGSSVTFLSRKKEEENVAISLKPHKKARYHFTGQIEYKVEASTLDEAQVSKEEIDAHYDAHKGHLMLYLRDSSADWPRYILKRELHS